MTEYYDRQGKWITAITWVHFIEDKKYSIVEQTVISDSITVSTVWTGIHMGGFPKMGNEEIFIFETMVFIDGESHECLRYSTEEEARAGHTVFVNQYEAAEPRESIEI